MMKLKKPWALRDAKASPLGRGGIAIRIGFCQSDAIAVLFVL